MNSGKTKLEFWLDWELGVLGPDDLQVRMAHIYRIQLSKAQLNKTGSVLKTDSLFKKVFEK